MQVMRIRESIYDSREITIKMPEDFSDNVEIFVLLLETGELSEREFDFWALLGSRRISQWENEFNAEKIKKEFAAFLEVNHCSLNNSSSSSNLLTFMSLISPTLGEKQLKRGCQR